MASFRFNVDEVVEDLFHELEEQSDGGESHYCDIEAVQTNEDAAKVLCERLIPFFTKKFEVQEL